MKKGLIWASPCISMSAGATKITEKLLRDYKSAEHHALAHSGLTDISCMREGAWSNLPTTDLVTSATQIKSNLSIIPTT